MNRPNVLVVYADQFNSRCLSASGHPNVLTPGIDGLCAEGVRFTDAYAQNAVCTPSRISFLTGLYPSTHGYYGLYGREPVPQYSTIFSHFAEHGYRCGAIGKLHTPRYWIERQCQFVYDEFIEFPKYLEGAGLYDVNDNRKFTGQRDGTVSALPLERSCEAALVSQFRRFVANQGEPNDRAAEAEPWLAWASFARPHSPITPSEPFASMYDPADIVLPPSAVSETWTNLAEWSRKVPGLKGEPDETVLRNMIARYLGLVSQVDWAIGQIMAILAEEQILDRTVVVFTADHGDYAGEMGLWSKTAGIRSSAICRVPLVVRVPGAMPAEKVVGGIVETIDVLPTLCELAGICPKTPSQGRSFAPLLRGDDWIPRDDALTENAVRKALTTRKWRYLSNLPGQKDELFDREADPWETHNLVDEPELAPALTGLRARLLRRLAAARLPVVGYDAAQWQHEYDQDGFSCFQGNADFKNSL
jgi:arylsulfatase